MNPAKPTKATDMREYEALGTKAQTWWRVRHCTRPHRGQMRTSRRWRQHWHTQNLYATLYRVVCSDVPCTWGYMSLWEPEVICNVFLTLSPPCCLRQVPSLELSGQLLGLIFFFIFLYGCLGFKLGSSCFYGEHFYLQGHLSRLHNLKPFES